MPVESSSPYMLVQFTTQTVREGGFLEKVLTAKQVRPGDRSEARIADTRVFYEAISQTEIRIIDAELGDPTLLVFEYGDEDLITHASSIRGVKVNTDPEIGASAIEISSRRKVTEPSPSQPSVNVYVRSLTGLPLTGTIWDLEKTKDPETQHRLN